MKKTLLKTLIGSAILAGTIATPTAILLSHPTTSNTTNSKMATNSYLTSAPVNIDTIVPENSSLGNFMFQPAANSIISRLTSTFPTLDVDQIAISGITSTTAIITVIPSSSDYIPGSTTSVIFTIGTQVNLTTIIANDTNLNTAGIFDSNTPKFIDSTGLLSAIKTGLAKQGTSFYTSDVTATYSWNPAMDMCVGTIAAIPNSLIYQGSTEIMFNTYRPSMTDAAWITTDLGTWKSLNIPLLLNVFAVNNENSQAYPYFWNGYEYDNQVPKLIDGVNMSLSDIVNNQASISVTGDEYYTGSVEVSVVINSAKDVSTAFTGLTNIEFDGYNPETYQQVISVLRTMGYTEDKVSYDSLNISIDSNNSTIIISAKTGSQIYTGSMTVPYIVTNMNTATKQDLGDVFAGVTSIKDENGTSANNQSEAKSDLIKMGYTQDKISYSYLNITVTKTFYSPVYWTTTVTIVPMSEILTWFLNPYTGSFQVTWAF